MATREQRRAVAISRRAIARAERRRQLAISTGEVPADMTVEQFIVWEDKRNADEQAIAEKSAVPASAAAGSTPIGLASAVQAATPFFDRYGRPLYLSNHFGGGSLFLILSGPSINSLDLSLLDRRGIVTMGLNNSPAIRRTHLWVYVDRANKFHQSIWLDPAVTKFVPAQHMNKALRQKLPDGTFCNIVKAMPDGSRPIATPRDMPNVIACRRNAYFEANNWLCEASINWGNSRRSAARNRLPHILNVMLTAIKTAYAIGFRTVYLLGCDFYMTSEQPYAFRQAKSAGGAASNNNSYQTLNEMFRMLKPKFDEAGFRVFNCNPRSGLTVFPATDYKAAIEAATAHVAQDPLDTDGWYEV